MKKRNAMIRGLGILVMVPVLLAPAGCGKDENNERGTVASQEGDDNGNGDNGEDTSVDRAIPVDVTEDGNGQDTGAPEVTEGTDENEYLAYYAPIITEISGVFLNGYDEDAEYEYIGTGLMEKLMYEGEDAVQKSVGYVLMDINGDDVPELLIGENASNGMNEKECAYIYSGYTLFEDYLLCFIDGYTRSSYQWIGDNSFYYFGSNGAMSSMFGTCHLSANGKNLEWDDFYFSDENNGITSYYHNNTGEFDVENSTWLNLEAEDFWKIMDTYDMQTLPFTPFAEDTGSAGSSTLTPVTDREITGSWYLRSYVDRSIAGYRFFEDGTWLAVETGFGTGDRDEDALSGTWKQSGSGYTITDEAGNLLYNAQICEDENRDPVLDCGDIQFYMSYAHMGLKDPLDDYFGTWLYPNGASLVLKNDYTWELLDDSDNWLFSGQWVANDGSDPIRIRLHSNVGDAGNRPVADGELAVDTTGDKMIAIKFVPYLTDFTDSDAVLYKKP